MKWIEEKRLEERDERGNQTWRNWGPYLSERQWGTVREDYSKNGSAWSYFPHDHARSRVYRWGEDGIAGISDKRQNLCFSLGIWNGNDDILKERLYGLTGEDGNHGEDVKELYYYLDNTPSHSYMKYLYKLQDNIEIAGGPIISGFSLTHSGTFTINPYALNLTTTGGNVTVQASNYVILDSTNNGQINIGGWVGSRSSPHPLSPSWGKIGFRV